MWIQLQLIIWAKNTVLALPFRVKHHTSSMGTCCVFLPLFFNTGFCGIPSVHETAERSDTSSAKTSVQAREEQNVAGTLKRHQLTSINYKTEKLRMMEREQKYWQLHMAAVSLCRSLDFRIKCSWQTAAQDNCSRQAGPPWHTRYVTQLNQTYYFLAVKFWCIAMKARRYLLQ